ncbi:MAG: TerB family tellurite resistance protein [Sphingobacteriales bacterium]
MKIVRKIGVLAFLIAIQQLPCKAKAQTIADDLQQLSLDYRKLAGLKNILKQMYQGYALISQSYHAVSAVSAGNFKLHEAFLDGLLIVSPAVRTYPRAAAIVRDQASIMREFKSAYKTFRSDKHFSPDELSYMLDVYNNLVSQSLNNLSDLALFLTDGRLRMSDAERLSAIDGIYTQSRVQLNFLRNFNNQAYQVAAARSRDDSDKQSLKKVYGAN